MLLGKFLYYQQLPKQLQDVSDVGKDIVQHGLQTNDFSGVLLGLLAMFMVASMLTNLFLLRSNNLKFNKMQSTVSTISEVTKDIQLLKTEIPNTIIIATNKVVEDHDKRVLESLGNLKVEILNNVIQILSKEKNTQNHD